MATEVLLLLSFISLMIGMASGCSQLSASDRGTDLTPDTSTIAAIVASVDTGSGSNLSCGVTKFNNAAQSGAGVVGGKLAVDGEIPWQARLIANNILCGGVLIQQNWVLTAAHCCPIASGTAQSLNPISVALGSASLYGPFEYAEYSTSYIRHPKYNSESFDFDYCLVSLPKPVKYSDNIRPICLAHDSSASQQCQPQDIAVVSGWGLNTTDPNVGNIQSVLKVNKVPVVSQSACQSHFPVTITNNMLCAGGVYGQGTCNGDSGGPMACLKNNKYILSGIASFRSADGCAKNDPGAYASVSSAYATWIRQYVSGV